MEEERTAAEIVKTLESSRKYKKIKAGLVKQLKTKNADTPYFLSLIDDYMAMWVSKELLYQDIQERGCMVPYDNGGGQRDTDATTALQTSTRPTPKCLSSYRN